MNNAHVSHRAAPATVIGGVAGRLVRPLGHPVLVAAALSVFFAIGAVASSDIRVADTDVFWLAAVGRDIVRHHAMPHVNGYSFADGSHPWVMHEGLFGVLYFAGLRALGPGFFTLAGLVAGSATILLSLAWVFGQSRSAAAGALGALVLLSTERSFFFPRPSFTVLPLVVAMVMLVMGRGWSPARAAGALLVELVWTNAHGSFVLGIVLVAAAALDEGRSSRQRRAWLLTAVAAALVTLVNPYGWKLHGLVDRYLRGDDPTAELIQTHIQGFETLWEAVYEGGTSGRQAEALGVIAVVALRALARRKRVARAVVVMTMVVMAVYQARNVVPAILLGVLLLHDVADDLLGWVSAARLTRRQGLGVAAAVVLPGLLLGIVQWTRARVTRPPLAWIHPSLGGEPFLRLAHALPPGARVYAPFKPAAMVLWFESPRGVKVLYDPRNDCYSADVVRGALELHWPDNEKSLEGRKPGGRPVADFLEKYGTEYVLATRGVVATDLGRDAAWEVWRKEGEWTAFRRKAQRPTGSPDVR